MVSLQLAHSENHGLGEVSEW